MTVIPTLTDNKTNESKPNEEKTDQDVVSSKPTFEGNPYVSNLT